MALCKYIKIEILFLAISSYLHNFETVKDFFFPYDNDDILVQSLKLQSIFTYYFNNSKCKRESEPVVVCFAGNYTVISHCSDSLCALPK